MVHHDLVLQPGDTLRLRVADTNDRSTTAPRDNDENSQAGNWEGGKRQKRQTRKAKKESQTGGKRALTGYMKFVKATRPEILKENPGMEFKDVGKRLGEKWRSLSAAEKSRY